MNLDSLSSLLKSPSKAPSFLVDRLLLDRTIVGLSAEPFVGKTMFMLSLGLSLDTCFPFLGNLTVPNNKRVLFLGQDSPKWDYIEQCRRLGRGMGLFSGPLGTVRDIRLGAMGAVQPDPIDLLDMHLILNQDIDLTDRNCLDELESIHDRFPFEVLMLDTFLDFHKANENSNSEMAAVMKVLRKIQEGFGCALLFSTHTSKPGPGIESAANYRSRGASTIAGKMDFHFMLKRKGNLITLSVPKARGLAEEPSFQYTMTTSLTPQGYATVLQQVLPPEPALLLALRAACAQPRRRADLLALVGTSGLVAASEAERALDTALQTLKRQGLLWNPQHGLWQAKP